MPIVSSYPVTGLYKIQVRFILSCGLDGNENRFSFSVLRLGSGLLVELACIANLCQFAVDLCFCTALSLDGHFLAAFYLYVFDLVCFCLVVGLFPFVWKAFISFSVAFTTYIIQYSVCLSLCTD